MEWKSSFTFGFFEDKRSTTKKIWLRGNPLVAVIVILMLGFLGYAFYLLGAKVIIGYFPYEGTVVKIQSDWVDDILAEGLSDQCLTIKNKDGVLITRYVSGQYLVKQGIAVGDYVVKEKGFAAQPRVSGKITDFR